MADDSGQLSTRPIGVFDSGIGGLTVVAEIMRAMGGEDIVYLGDSARVPYGIKSPQTIQRFAVQDLKFLLSHRPKMVVVACNTASAAAIEILESSSPVVVVDVIRPGARAAVEAVSGPIGVLGTEATVASGAYQRAIEAASPGREVLAVACPLLVPIVEEGRDGDDPIVLHVLCDYLRELQRARPGAVILGCTHYPLLAGAIGKLLGPRVTLINSGSAAAREVADVLKKKGLANLRPQGGVLRCFTTDNPQRFARLAERFGGGRKPDGVDYVATDELEAHVPQK
ncbi:MAG: glutamate racemase [Planctomycetes bacterium]|nr:glutamate racemase [Planctomycetota bacterium]